MRWIATVKPSQVVQEDKLDQMRVLSSSLQRSDFFKISHIERGWVPSKKRRALQDDKPSRVIVYHQKNEVDSEKNREKKRNGFPP